MENRTVRINTDVSYELVTIFKVTAHLRTNDELTTYDALFEEIPTCGHLNKLILSVGEAMLGMAENSLIPEKIVADLKRRGQRYMALAAYIFRQAEWPPTAHETGYAQINLTDNGRIVGNLFLCQHGIWRQHDA
jgi:hypothetical protein